MFMQDSLDPPGIAAKLHLSEKTQSLAALGFKWYL